MGGPQFVGRLNGSQGYGFGVIGGPLGNRTALNSGNVDFVSGLIQGIGQTPSIPLGQIQVVVILNSLPQSQLEGLKQLGTKTVLDTVIPQLTGRSGTITTVQLADVLNGVSIPKIEAAMPEAVVTVAAPLDLAQPEIFAQGKPMVIGSTGETVFVATANVDEINPQAPVSLHEVGLNKTEVRSLTSAEIQILKDKGNVGNLDKVFVPVGMKAEEVAELLSGIQDNVILGEVVLIPVLGKITIKGSVLNKIAIVGEVTIQNSDLENVKLATDGGAIRKSIIIGAKIEGTVDIYQSVVINSNVSDQSTINFSLIQFAEVESRSNISRSQLIGTEQKPLYVNAMNGIYQFHALGSRRESTVLPSYTQRLATPEFIRSNMRALIQGEPVFVHNTGIESPLYDQALNSNQTRILDASEIEMLRKQGIIINSNTVIRVAEGIDANQVLSIVQPGAVLSGVITFNSTRDVKIAEGAVVNNAEFGEAVIIEKNSIVSDSFLDNVSLHGSTVRDSYLKRVTVEEEAVILNTTLVNDNQYTVVGRFSNVFNSHLRNIGVVKFALIGNTLMENENGETVIGGSIFGQNVKFSDGLRAVTEIAKSSIASFFKGIDPSLELAGIRFAGGQTNEVLFQIDADGKVTVTIMADVREGADVIQQWSKNPRQLASRFFILGMLARPNIPYIEAITPRLEQAAEGKGVGFRVDVVEMAERRSSEQTLTGRKVAWELPSERTEIVDYIEGKTQNAEAARTKIINIIDRLADSANDTGNFDFLKDVLYIFEDNATKSRDHYRRIADVVKGLKPETKALLQDIYQYEFIVR